MSVEIEIGRYSDTKDLGGFQKMEVSSIDEAISNIEFLKLGYDYFKNGECLVVRLEKGSKPYLIEFDSVVPIQELRIELEGKYNNKQITQDDEIEFTITEKPQKTPLNSNFIFIEDDETRYAKTTTGESLPFKLFRTDDSDTRSNLLRELTNSAESTDFALVERRFSENNSLQFFGSERIEGLNDVAWLFRSLEDEAVEHAFLVYDFEDKGYFVQHISTGSYNAALIDNRQIIGNVIEANPSSITLVHNHPSGNLKASRADINVLTVLKKALQNTDVKVNDGIIINVRSGNYLVFNEKEYQEKIERLEDSKKLENVQAYSFSKQIFVKNFQPIRVNSPDDVAAYLTSQKFGVSDKNEMLVLNAQLNIVGKFILPVNNQDNFIIQKVSRFGGTSCVLYRNNISPELIEFYSKRLENSNITITDALLLKSENGKKIWESFISEGKIQKNNNADTLRVSENNQSNVTIMKKDLSWTDRVVTPKTQAYKDFVKNLENTSPEQWNMNGERNFTEKEKKFLKIYEKLNNKKITQDYKYEVTLLKNNKAETGVSFGTLTDVVEYVKELDFSQNKSFVFKDLATQNSVIIKNVVDREKFLSDLWAKELEKKTDLSSGLTLNKIDELQANHYRNYEKELFNNKNVFKTFIGVNPVEIQHKANELANLLENGKNTIVLTSKGKYAQVNTEVDTLNDLIKNLEKEKIKDNQSVEIRPFGTREGFKIEDDLIRSQLLNELAKIIPNTVYIDYLYRYNKVFEAEDSNEKIALYKNLDAYISEITEKYQVKEKDFLLNVDDFTAKKYDSVIGEELRDSLYKEIDLFENYELIPDNIQNIYESMMETESAGELDYKDIENYLSDFNKSGYTFDYGLDGQPYYLRPVNVQEQVKLNSEVANFKELYKDQIEIEKGDVIGKLSFYDNNGKIAEVMKYYSPDSYITALREELNSNIGGFKHETLLQDPQLYKDVDDLIFGAYGDDNPYSLEYYNEKINQEKNNKNHNSQNSAHSSMTDEEFIIEDLKITQEQRVSASNYFEFGINDGKHNLTDEQMSKIPDVIDNFQISRMEKMMLALESLEMVPYAIRFQITEDNRILKSSLDENLGEIKEYLKVNEVKFNKEHLKIMENQKDFDQLTYLKDQLKYLGFGEDEKIHKALEVGISSSEKKFQIQTISDKTLPGNRVDFTINFGKSEQGGVFLNSYDASLTNPKGENITQNFKVSKDNSYTAKEAVNLLEGRSVKIEFTNPKTEQKEQAFVKLNVSEEKNQYGNYNFQTFHQNYGVDAKQIVEKSNLIFDKPEFKDSAIKSLEKGNVVKVKFEMDDKTIEGKAVLNPQYKTLNLYDTDMNRINTNKPLQGVENDNSHEKSNVREQSISRGI